MGIFVLYTLMKHKEIIKELWEIYKGYKNYLNVCSNEAISLDWKSSEVVIIIHSDHSTNTFRISIKITKV